MAPIDGNPEGFSEARVKVVDNIGDDIRYLEQLQSASFTFKLINFF